MISRRERIFARLAELNAGPKRSLGQNFLISDNVIDKIIFAVKAEPFTEIIEVGPGLGALTEDLVELSRERSCRLTLIELDKAFAAEWRKVEGPRVIEDDALQINWKSLELAPGAVFVSNLPYQISSSIAIERSVEPAGVTRMILMFQREVAQRINARAKTPDYGLLTVAIQAFWTTSTVVDAGPKDFHPAPNVASRVVVFRRRPEQGLGEGFFKFAKAAFAHRRKLLTKNLSGTPGVPEALATMKLLPTARAEELSPEQFIELYRLLKL